MSDRAKEALRAETTHLRATAQDVLLSGAYFYPFKARPSNPTIPFHGIIHLATHKSLYTPLRSLLTQTLIAGASITTALFVFTYVPQTALLTFTSGPLFAPIAGALLVLAEASAVTHFVARGWIIRDALVDVFDAVLLERGCEGLVKEGRVVRSNVNSLMGRLGKMVKKPFGSGSGSGGAGGVVGGMIRSMVLLPLNFVPVVGTLLYVYVKGKKAGPGLHARYFQLRGFGGRDREEWVQKRRGGYTGLGMASVLLEMVPFASMLFEFSNAVGAALWAADLEKANK
ncbi:hypothetical protein ASPSYDRAFT_154879 [Aspergillus sydowii CBS 593.65]|uniref:Outer spore wall protein RRT8 n=1 Tax=Aspergillus sydowii CBS 593.65 TaxID=1036612 RepID=A0A1L9TC42_9EURO|nr:uncharacterized protein ASPSYDRAFT_154879 [Aspergillus sydowii CBS 593.65]OJJ56955.1 hypothetical protein ASPSYDRAFT_154879 [Aspergillus sydowii CBS 593.65]